MWVSQARALVSVDTTSATLDGKRSGEASKMMYIPHAGVLVAVNGYLPALPSLFSWLYNNFQDDLSIDGIPDWMPAQINAPEIRPHVEGTGLVVAFVGFSHQAKRFRCFRIALHGGHEFSTREVLDRFLLPGDPWSPADLPSPDNKTRSLSIAKRQVEWARRSAPGEPIGGRLLLGELTREGARIYEAGHLG